jgi:hypothetical protein
LARPLLQDFSCAPAYFKAFFTRILVYTKHSGFFHFSFFPHLITAIGHFTFDGWSQVQNHIFGEAAAAEKFPAFLAAARHLFASQRGQSTPIGS